MELTASAWLCWISPLAGAPIILLADKISRWLRDGLAVGFPFLSLIASLLLLPNLFNGVYFEEEIAWFSILGFRPISVGVLVDPLSIVMVNVVTFISFLIMVYSLKYMEHEQGVARYWFFMNLFIGGMVLLVMSNNFIFFLVGWKIVGLCSYTLIGHYYRDEQRHWIGGPPPTPRYPPSYCGLKAWIVTNIGDTLLLAGLILLYVYAGTANFTELFKFSSQWMPEVASKPGMLTLIGILLLCGPLGKSAQFPLHEWLPEAMAGPAPVSALIHAATMVKAGVYMIARFLPIFYYGYWVGGFDEALSFFLLAAYIGAFTAFLTGTQAMVSLELKKALAYSTMSQIGYMMLSLGIAGLNPKALVYGYLAGLFHLISHALFKAALFLGSGTMIHGCKSIYMSDMGGLKRHMPITWFLMWVASLSLAGFPLLSGFWSKDAILISCLLAENYWLFTFALGTAAVTAFYSIRFMGLSFHGEKSSHLAKLEERGERPREASPIMWIPYAIMVGLTILLGILGPNFEGLLHEVFKGFFYGEPPLPTNGVLSPIPLQVYVTSASIGIFLCGAIPAYMLYVTRKASPEKILSRYPVLKPLRSFFWDRWRIDSFYNMIFVERMLRLRPFIGEVAERVMDVAFNLKIPMLMEFSYLKTRRLQIGILSYYAFYVTLFMAILIISLLAVWPFVPT